MRNKPDIDEVDIDDLYNNLRVYEDELKRWMEYDLEEWIFDGRWLFKDDATTVHKKVICARECRARRSQGRSPYAEMEVDINKKDRKQANNGQNLSLEMEKTDDKIMRQSPKMSMSKLIEYENGRSARWFKKMETVFHISNCLEKYQVKYATCTLLNSALTWWNLYKRTIRAEAAFAMSWRELMKLMTEVYCPRNEIQKMESELLNLTVKNNDLAAYTQRFQELTMMCTKMVPEEEDRVEKFIGGLPNNI
ncbi:reverse transcriptase domain-containing protein [Tanacetum coccineum]|uniref:Reverse transcriptase domain-containing protein n=1 Tax=Tanacetum coccineum TaxID=301880 RepID=A0ABQ5IES8_9ASTR